MKDKLLRVGIVMTMFVITSILSVAVVRSVSEELQASTPFWKQQVARLNGSVPQEPVQIRVGQRGIAALTNGQPAWFYSKDPVIVSVEPVTGVIWALNPGTTKVCVQRQGPDLCIKVTVMHPNPPSDRPMTHSDIRIPIRRS